MPSEEEEDMLDLAFDLTASSLPDYFKLQNGWNENNTPSQNVI